MTVTTNATGPTSASRARVRGVRPGATSVQTSATTHSGDTSHHEDRHLCPWAPNMPISSCQPVPPDLPIALIRDHSASSRNGHRRQQGGGNGDSRPCRPGGRPGLARPGIPDAVGGLRASARLGGDLLRGAEAEQRRLHGGISAVAGADLGIEVLTDAGQHLVALAGVEVGEHPGEVVEVGLRRGCPSCSPVSPLESGVDGIPEGLPGALERGQRDAALRGQRVVAARAARWSTRPRSSRPGPASAAARAGGRGCPRRRAAPRRRPAGGRCPGRSAARRRAAPARSAPAHRGAGASGWRCRRVPCVTR